LRASKRRRGGGIYLYRSFGLKKQTQKKRTFINQVGKALGGNNKH